MLKSIAKSTARIQTLATSPTRWNEERSPRRIHKQGSSYQMVSPVCHAMGLNMQRLSWQPGDPKFQRVHILPP